MPSRNLAYSAPSTDSTQISASLCGGGVKGWCVRAGGKEQHLLPALSLSPFAPPRHDSLKHSTKETFLQKIILAARILDKVFADRFQDSVCIFHRQGGHQDHGDALEDTLVREFTELLSVAFAGAVLEETPSLLEALPQVVSYGRRTSVV